MTLRKISIGHRLNLGFTTLLLLFAALTVFTTGLASYQKQTLLAAMHTEQARMAAERALYAESKEGLKGLGLA